MTDITKTRLDYYKNSGKLLSQEEIYFYIDIGAELSPEFKDLMTKSDAKNKADINLELRAIEEAENATIALAKSKKELEAKTRELETSNLKLIEDNNDARMYTLEMEKVNSDSSIKMTSLIIVMSFITIPVVGMMFLIGMSIEVPGDFTTGIFSIASMLIGSFLTKLLIPDAAPTPPTHLSTNKTTSINNEENDY